MASHGAGIHLRSTASPQQISNALAQLIRDPGYTTAAQAIGVRIRVDTADNRTIHQIEGIAR